MLRVGDKAPTFSLEDQYGHVHTLSDYTGSNVLLYFYPKDDTPGCTTESCNFRDAYESLKDNGLVILGVSKDSVKSHKKFADKFSLPFPLLSDESTETIRNYGAWKKKKFMGRDYMGTDRISFLIDGNGIITKIYDQVRPADHAQEVLMDTK